MAKLRRALVCAGALAALAVLAACSGSDAPAGPTATSPSTASTTKPAGTSSPSGSTAPSGGSSPSVPPPPTGSQPTSVAPPVPGNIGQTVASGTPAPLPKVGLETPVRFRKVPLTAAILGPARVHAEAHIPGEIAGPALSFTLQLTNRGRAGLDLSTNIAVTAQDAAGVPFTALTTSTHPAGGTLRGGARASGRYVFHLPDSTKNPVTIEVTYAATVEVARFVGPIS